MRTFVSVKRDRRAVKLAGVVCVALGTPIDLVAQSPVVTLDWVTPPQATTEANGRLRGGQVIAKDARGNGVRGAQLIVVIGDRPDVLGTQELLAGSLLTTAHDGTARLDSVRVGGRPRLVHLAVQAERGPASRVVSVTVPPPSADSIDVIQRPIEVWQNGAPLSPPPQVRVFSRREPVGGVKVSFALERGDALLTGNEAESDDRGVARFSDLRLSSPCAGGTCTPQVLVARADPAPRSPEFTIKLLVPNAHALELQSEAPTALVAGDVVTPAVRLAAVDSQRKPIPGAVITARDPRGTVIGTAHADASGHAIFPELRLFGRAGPTRITFTAGRAQHVVNLALLPGHPSSMVIVSQPPGRVAFDSTWASPAVVGVRDDHGNPVPGVVVRALLCMRRLSNTARETRTQDAFTCGGNGRVAEFLGYLVGGPTSVRTNDEGLAIFDSLRLQGREGEYRMTFMIDADPSVTTVSSNSIIHDPKRDFDQNFVVISAIKTVSGVAPENEFFDLRFRFRLSRFMHLLSNTDVSMTSRGTDSVASKQKRLTEAALMVNGNLFMPRANVSDVPQRLVYAGAQVKVFNTIPYYGVQIGGTELGGSAFQGSTLTVSYLRRWYGDDLVIVEGDSVFTAENNVGFDFFLRSSVVEFFKVLTIRGGVVAPLRPGARLTSRIAIAIPVGDIYRF